MHSGRITLIASLIVVGTGALWGFYWVPVRQLSQAALPGAWGTAAITAAAMVLLFPFAITRRRNLLRSSALSLAAVALGGAAFALYSIGFVYGRVAIIILLFFLTPVWSTLIGAFIMGWHTPKMRIWAIATGLVGLGVMLGADGEFPLPRGAGEWLALMSGILWSFATTGIRAKPDLQPIEASFVFAFGATAAAVLIAPVLQPWHGTASVTWSMIGLVTVTGGLWWGLSMAALMWATARLDPARVGILLMTEVLVGSLSAAVIAGERLSAFEVAGGTLVLCAAVLEVWPIHRKTRQR